MNTFHFATDNNEEIVLNNFPPELFDLIPTFTNKPSPIIVIIDSKKIKARVGVKSNSYGKLILLTTEDKYVKSFKKFKEFLNLSIISLESIINLKLETIKKQNKISEELIHNLTSLNTYNIQDLFALIPQELLTENINKQRDIIKNILVEKPNVTTNTLLQLIKYNLAMKVEFSVFEKTLEKYPSVQKNENLIRKIILSVLQIFITDFEKKKIEVFLSETNKLLLVDYDTLFVSLYYLFDNSLKYCSANSNLKIYFDEEEDCFSISLKMLSIRIEPNEIDKLCWKDYRSNNAKVLNTTGKGIGMFRIIKTLKLNNAILEIKPRISNHTRKSKQGLYEHNLFKIKFKGQQDWFADK